MHPPLLDIWFDTPHTILSNLQSSGAEVRAGTGAGFKKNIGAEDGVEPAKKNRPAHQPWNKD